MISELDVLDQVQETLLFQALSEEFITNNTVTIQRFMSKAAREE
jgi:hypothetical protein